VSVTDLDDDNNLLHWTAHLHVCRCRHAVTGDLELDCPTMSQTFRAGVCNRLPLLHLEKLAEW